MQFPITITLANSHYLARVGLRYLISQRENYKLIAETTNEGQLLASLKSKVPQVVIIDHDQPKHFSFGTLEAIKKIAPASQILIISGDEDKSKIDQILEFGVNSFLTKCCDEKEIFDAIDATAKREKFFCTNILNYLLKKSYAKESETEEPSTPLTPREIEIVQLIAKGLIAKEIARTLHLSTHTVYTHRKNIMKKLSLNTASELVLYALNNGLLAQ